MIVSVSVTCVPAIFNTLMVPSARLHTSAILPSGLNDRPEGCLPSVTVCASFGGLALRSMTNSLSVGTILRAPLSSTTVIESATSAMLLSGEMARLVGGPTIEFSSCKVATIFGASGFARSMICTLSLPVGEMIGLPWSSQRIFSSLPTIMNGLAWARLRLELLSRIAAPSDSPTVLVTGIMRVLPDATGFSRSGLRAENMRGTRLLPTRSRHPSHVRSRGTLACAPQQTELDLWQRGKRRVTRNGACARRRRRGVEPPRPIQRFAVARLMDFIPHRVIASILAVRVRYRPVSGSAPPGQP